MITLTAPHCSDDYKRDAATRHPISAITTISLDSLKKPLMLGIERDPTVYSTLVEFGIIDDVLTH